MLSILSCHGCTDMPTPDNLIELIVKEAKFQFCFKSTAIIVAMHTGIPPEHKRFWENQGVQGILSLYLSLSLSRQKILSLIHCQYKSPAEEECMVLTKHDRKYEYQRSCQPAEISIGSSVAIENSIEVTFNFTSGYSRSPFGRTCGNTLELPLQYNNYDDSMNGCIFFQTLIVNGNGEWTFARQH